VIETAKHEGREQGRQEGRIAIAKVLKKNGVPVDIIIKSTGLTKEHMEIL
jgi:predicted transposase/invertase (TIGR01784 family)